MVEEKQLIYYLLQREWLFIQEVRGIVIKGDERHFQNIRTYSFTDLTVDGHIFPKLHYVLKGKQCSAQPLRYSV